MATGIEIAGLALAAFPIVIDGLSHFVEGVRIIKTWGAFRRELASYQHGLRSARAFFQNTLEELLEGIATQEDILTFRSHPDTMATPNPLYEEQLKVRLDHDYKNCLEAMVRILSAMEALRKKLDLDAAGKIIWDDYPTIKREVKRIKLVLSKKIYQGLLNEIDKANQDLLQRTQQGRRLEPSRSRRQSNKRMAEFATVRSRVRSLWKTLITGRSWCCSCQNHHAASLRLEPRLWEEDNREGHIRFQLLLSRQPSATDFDPSWSDQVIEVLSSEPLQAVEQALASTSIDQRYVWPVVSYMLSLLLLVHSLAYITHGFSYVKRFFLQLLFLGCRLDDDIRAIITMVSLIEVSNVLQLRLESCAEFFES
ncbi:MAG: hypothetical protein Q9221_007349 [Calogaya cf. arnoldii]